MFGYVTNWYLILGEQSYFETTWQAALKSLTSVRRVMFDLEHEGFCFDSDAVSHRARLWGNLLGLMLAHAWLEQRNREVMELPSGEPAVLATPEAYEAAYLIFKATYERLILNLSDTQDPRRRV